MSVAIVRDILADLLPRLLLAVKRSHVDGDPCSDLTCPGMASIPERKHLSHLPPSHGRIFHILAAGPSTGMLDAKPGSSSSAIYGETISRRTAASSIWESHARTNRLRRPMLQVPSPGCAPPSATRCPPLAPAALMLCDGSLGLRHSAPHPSTAGLQCSLSSRCSSHDQSSDLCGALPCSSRGISFVPI